MGLTLLSAVVFVASVCLVQANSAGPPSSACSSLTPGHGTRQTSTVPYQIDLAQFSDGNGGYEYTPGQTYTREYRGVAVLLVKLQYLFTYMYIQYFSPHKH